MSLASLRSFRTYGYDDTLHQRRQNSKLIALRRQANGQLDLRLRLELAYLLLKLGHGSDGSNRTRIRSEESSACHAANRLSSAPEKGGSRRQEEQLTKTHHAGDGNHPLSRCELES